MALFNRLTTAFRGATSLFARQCHAKPVSIETQEQHTKEVFKTVNNIISENLTRNFAIVHLAGKQWRVTDGDLVAIEGYWPPTTGDEIVFDKILLAGNKDFTVVGRPLVQKGLVEVKATIVSKGLSHTRSHFKKKPKKQYMRLNFNRQQQTILRINSVSFTDKLNQPSNVY